jgi:hypothetical protein
MDRAVKQLFDFFDCVKTMIYFLSAFLDNARL